MKSAFVIAIVAALAIGASIGVTIGVMIIDFPFFNLEKNIAIDDIIQVALSILALPVGAWLINKWLDERRHVKNFLIEELRCYLKITDEIKNYIDLRNGGEAKTASSDDKKYIMLRMKGLERQLNAFGVQIQKVYKKNGKAIPKALRESHDKYWKGITEDLLIDGRQFDEAYKKIADVAYDNHSLDIKMGIFDLNSL